MGLVVCTHQWLGLVDPEGRVEHKIEAINEEMPVILPRKINIRVYIVYYIYTRYIYRLYISYEYHVPGMSLYCGS